MVKYKYGEFKTKQIRETKETIRKQIFFLLLLADPATKGQYPDVDIKLAFDNLLHKYQYITHMSDKKIYRLCILLNRQINKLRNIINEKI